MEKIVSDRSFRLTRRDTMGDKSPKNKEKKKKKQSKKNEQKIKKA
jgi:hypothetical protein